MLPVDTNYTLHACMCAPCMAAHVSTLHIYPYIPACPCQLAHDPTLHIHLRMHTCMHAPVYASLELCMCAHVHVRSTPSTAFCSLLASVMGSSHFIHFITDSKLKLTKKYKPKEFFF